MQQEQQWRTRILVVDESRESGNRVCEDVSRTADLQCVGLGIDHRSSLELFEQHQPRAVVVGLRRRGGHALALVSELTDRYQAPVLALGADNQLGAELTIEALERGALDYLVSPPANSAGGFRLRDELNAKLRGMLRCRSADQSADAAPERRLKSICARASIALDSEYAAQQLLCDAGQRIVVVGAGAGGPRALLRFVPELRVPLSPIVVAQPLTAQLVAALAQRLDALSPVRCKVAENGDVLLPNTVYLAPADQYTVVVREAGRPTLLVHADLPHSVPQRGPSIDVLMQSAAIAYGNKCLGVLLTGNGLDGVAGARAIAVAGGFLLGQEESNCYAEGTIRRARQLNCIDRQFQLDDAAEALVTVAPYLGRPEISIVRSPLLDPNPLHACAT